MSLFSRLTARLSRSSKAKPWCCQRFHQAFENRLNSGPFVYARPPQEDGAPPTYLFALRVVTKAHLKGFSAVIAASGYSEPVQLENHLTIRFCPWCGASLEHFYSTNYYLLVAPEVCVPPDSTLSQPVIL